MATGKSGYFDLTGSNTTFALRVNWSETYEITTNKSVVTIDSVQVKSTGWYGFTYYPDGLIKINGTTVITMNSGTGTHSVRTNKVDEWYTILTGGETATGSVEVAHNTDGSKSVSIEVTGNRYSKCFFYTAAGGTDGGNGWGATGSKTVALTTIPRASTIGASDANIGSKSTIVVTQKSTAYTHSIAYKFGSLTGYVTAAGGVSSTEVKYSTTSISWTVPTDFYAQIPNAKTGTCTLTIKTYSGSTQIGDAQTDTFTVTAAQSACAPSVSGSVVDSNSTTKALTGDESKLVRYYSTALCTITATAKNSATISSKKIGGTAVSGTTRSIAKVEVDSVSFYAKDSRGYEASTDVDFTLVPYVILTNNSSGQRTDPTSGNAKLTIKGDYFNGSFGSVSNALTIKYRFREVDGTYGSYTTVTPTISGNSYTVTLSLTGLDYEHSYEFEIVVSDKLATVTKVVTIKQGIPVFDWGQSDFRINVALRLLGAAYGTSLPTTGKEGQVFFLLSNGSYTVKIHNGTSWV